MVSDGKGTTLFLNDKGFRAFLSVKVGLSLCFLGRDGEYVYFCIRNIAFLSF